MNRQNHPVQRRPGVLLKFLEDGADWRAKEASEESPHPKWMLWKKVREQTSTQVPGREAAM